MYTEPKSDCERATHKKYDVIVVGSGPGGATAAKELSEKGASVLVVEQGKNEPIRGNYTQCVGMALIPGKSLKFTNRGLGVLRAITTGGSSVIYAATAYEPPYQMLKSYDVDIYKEVELAKKELPIAPLEERLMGPAARKIMESATSLGYDWQKLPKFIYQNLCRPDCDKCLLGCPYDAKWGARNYMTNAIEEGTLLIDRAKVTKVVTERGKAHGVEYVKGRTRYRAYSDKVVVAAGGIGTPDILRASGISNAGYDFFFDPFIFVFGTVDGMGIGREIPMSTGIRIEEAGLVMTDMTLPKRFYQLFNAEVGRLDKLFSHSKTLTILVKIRDRLGGKITGNSGVRKGLTKEDFDKLYNGFDKASQILKNAGAKSIHKSWYLASHPGGTSKIGEIVDTNLESKIRDLYVCDCSVIPGEMGLPPTLTIIGLAKRLSSYIARN